MYAKVIRRRPNPETQPENLQRAAEDFYPELRQAPGFVAYYLVAGEDGLNTAITVWEDHARAEAFRSTLDRWASTLEQRGSQQVSRTAGEVLVAVTP